MAQQQQQQQKKQKCTEEEEEKASQTTNSGALDIINAYGFKPYFKVCDMVQHSAYKIYGIRKIPTKYGDRVIVELQNNQMFLPARYGSLPVNVLEDIKQQDNFYVSNLGPIGDSFNLVFAQQNNVGNYNVNLTYFNPSDFYINNNIM